MKSLARAALRAAAVLAALAGSAAAHSDDPKFWTTDPPDGAAALDPRYVQMIVVKIIDEYDDPLSAVDVASAVVGKIIDRNLTDPEQVCVLLHGLALGGLPEGDPGTLAFAGTTPLLYASGDALDPSASAAGITHLAYTPWTSAGITSMSSWMSTFVGSYNAIQWLQGLNEEPVSPSPSRFHFDVEATLTPFNIETSRIFNWIVANDTRYGGENLAGFSPSATLSSLYSAAGSPPYLSGGVPADPTSVQAWYTWYSGVCRQVVDGAMKAAVYDVIHAGSYGFDEALCSNYEGSMRVDGSGARVYKDSCDAGAVWLWQSWKGSADLQAPVLYGVSCRHVAGCESACSTGCATESTASAALRRHRELLDACVQSYPLDNPVGITPWVMLPDNPLDECYTNFSFTESETRSLLAMARSKGISEYIVFSSGEDDESSWDKFVRAQEWAWGADLASYSIVNGSAGSAPSNPLTYSNYEPLPVTAVFDNASGKYIATIEVVFDSTFNQGSTTSGLDINLQAWCSTTGPSATMSVYDWVSSGFDPVTGVSIPAGTSSSPNRQTVGISGSEYIGQSSPNVGKVKLRIRYEHTASFTVSCDMVQVVKTST